MQAEGERRATAQRQTNNTRLSENNRDETHTHKQHKTTLHSKINTTSNVRYLDGDGVVTGCSSCRLENSKRRQPNRDAGRKEKTQCERANRCMCKRSVQRTLCAFCTSQRARAAFAVHAATVCLSRWRLEACRRQASLHGCEENKSAIIHGDHRAVSGES